MRAVLVFCEGPHDVRFVARSLGALGAYDWVDEKIAGLPTPFGPTYVQGNPDPIEPGVLVKYFYERPLDATSMAQLAHAPIPVFDAAVHHKATDTRYYLIRSGGDSQSAAVIKLIDAVDVAIEVGRMKGTAVTKEVAYAFLFDADTLGRSVREDRFRRAYQGWFGDLRLAQHETWIRMTRSQTNTQARVGLWIHHNPANNNLGTLEDHLVPLVEETWQQRWNGAGAYLVANAKKSDPVSNPKKPAESYKARIGITSQFLFPGDPMTMILHPRGLPKRCFQRPYSRRLVNFLQSVPW